MGREAQEVGIMMLLDSDIWIDFLRGSKDAEGFIISNMDTISFSAISEAELLSGRSCSDPKNAERIMHLLAQFEKIPVDNPMVQLAGMIRRAHDIALPDAMIAASAISTDATLVTRNIKDYRSIEGLELKKPY